MTWSELLFAHWSIDVGLVTEQLRVGLEVDTFNGQAWVGLVPLQMYDVAPRGFPAVPWLSRYLELNLCIYVVKDGKPGVSKRQLSLQIATWPSVCVNISC